MVQSSSSSSSFGALSVDFISHKSRREGETRREKRSGWCWCWGRTARAADTKGGEKRKKERRFSLLLLSLSLSCGVTIKFAKTDTLKVWRGRGLASNRRFPRTVASSGAVRKRKGGWTERRGLKSPSSPPLFATGVGAKSATHAPKETAGERKGKGAGRAKHIRSVLIEESRYPLSLSLFPFLPPSLKNFLVRSNMAPQPSPPLSFSYPQPILPSFLSLPPVHLDPSQRGKRKTCRLNIFLLSFPLSLPKRIGIRTKGKRDLSHTIHNGCFPFFRSSCA